LGDTSRNLLDFIKFNDFGGFPLTQHCVHYLLWSMSFLEHEQHEFFGDQLANVYQLPFDSALGLITKVRMIVHKDMLKFLKKEMGQVWGAYL
jgi:hypothetical protein